LNDDRKRVAELYKLHGPAIYRRCLRLLRDPEAAQDATQEVFGKLMRDLERNPDLPDALPWIFRVATNHCLNERRNAGRRRTDPLPELEIQIPAAEAPYPERQLAQRVLSRFDAETQAVAVGVLVDGMDHDEVASTLGISSRTVSRKLTRFLGNARKYLLRSEP
jgi:RNA polymerase sigma-70 factor, ECF subfamily